MEASGTKNSFKVPLYGSKGTVNQETTGIQKEKRSSSKVLQFEERSFNRGFGKGSKRRHLEKTTLNGGQPGQPGKKKSPLSRPEGKILESVLSHLEKGTSIQGNKQKDG